jgi:hypothetical protein
VVDSDVDAVCVGPVVAVVDEVADARQPVAYPAFWDALEMVRGWLSPRSARWRVRTPTDQHVAMSEARIGVVSRVFAAWGGL